MRVLLYVMRHMQVTRDAARVCGSKPAWTTTCHVLVSGTKDAWNKSFCYSFLWQVGFARNRNMCSFDREQIHSTIAAEANLRWKIEALV